MKLPVYTYHYGGRWYYLFSFSADEDWKVADFWRQINDHKDKPPTEEHFQNAVSYKSSRYIKRPTGFANSSGEACAIWGILGYDNPLEFENEYGIISP